MSAIFTDHPGGDIFASGADVLVCPVNCVPGVMGAGLALAFARRWPHLVASHRFACSEGFLRPGRVHTVSLKVTRWSGRAYESVGPDAACALFPTKMHWREPSRLEYVTAGLAVVAKKFAERDSIAIPALGCGLGGLDWADVRPLIVEALADLPLRVMLYPPHEVGQ